jgi:hypothetical protein
MRRAPRILRNSPPSPNCGVQFGFARLRNFTWSLEDSMSLRRIAALVTTCTLALTSACADDGSLAELDDGTAEGALEAQNSCLEGIANYQQKGPFRYDTRTSGKVKLWVPRVPNGCRVPVVHLANGTTASCSNYQGALERLATHGFLAACYEDPNTGAGEYGITALDTARRLYPDLVDNKFGSTGHSQGGQASLVTLQLAEAKYGTSMTYAGLAMEPASGYGTQPKGQSWQKSYGKIKSPVFMFSGDSSIGFANSSLLGFNVGDGLVAISWVNEGLNAVSRSIEAYHWTARGATHIPTPVTEEQNISIPWFRWKLLGDKAACRFFQGLRNGPKWQAQKEQNVQGC